MKTAVIAAMLAPLVAGSVHDQHGLPIAGAHIVFLEGTRTVGTAETSADGTFLFEGAAHRVRISCAYCERTARDIDDDGIVTAIVHRYDALTRSGPSADDVAHAPFADAVALLSLTPFAVVNTTTRTVPGASITNRNAGVYGGLLVIDGVPAYDPTAAITTFDTIPAGDVTGVQMAGADAELAYGNIAQGGTFAVSTAGGSSAAGAGNMQQARGAVDGTNDDASIAFAHADDGDRRQRASFDIFGSTPFSSERFGLSAGSATLAPAAESALRSSFSSASGAIESTGPVDARLNVSADRGTYDYVSSRFPEASNWDDENASVSIDARTALAPFANLSTRVTNARYASNANGVSAITGTIAESRTVGGIRYRSSTVDVVAGAGLDHATYALSGNPTAGGDTTDGVVSATIRNRSWELEGSILNGYTLDTLVSAYDAPYGTPVLQTGSSEETTLSFGDLARVRTSATALRWQGANGVATSSAGASLAWQVTPRVSLRAWAMHVQSTVYPSASVGSTWLTYDSGAVRADAMWIRSLNDGLPRGHVDAALSGHLTGRIDWYAASDDTYGRRFIMIGLRVQP